MTCRQPHTVLWTSEPLSIGKHQWRIVAAHFPHLEAVERATCEHGSAGRATFYEWRPLAYRGSPRDWRDEREWPSYDSDRSDCGTPRTLRKLWEREATTVRSILCLHCAAQTGTAPPQLSLFDSNPATGAAP